MPFAAMAEHVAKAAQIATGSQDIQRPIIVALKLVG